MSIRTMTRVWESSMQRGTALLLLLALADFADDSGGSALPSIHTLAAKARLSSRQVKRLVAQLAGSGELAVERNAGPHRVNRYYLLVQAKPDSDARDTVTSRHHDTDSTAKGTSASLSGVTTASPDPSSDPSTNRQGEHATVKGMFPDQQSEEAKTEPLTPPDLFEAWNEFAVPAGLPEAKSLTQERRRNAQLRLKEHPDKAFWETAFANLRESAFLRGLSNADGRRRKWRATFDWLIGNETNAIKLVEGNYG
jgi:hypothetical protein